MAASIPVSGSNVALPRGRGRARGIVGLQAERPGSESVPQKSVRDQIRQLKPSEIQNAVSFLTRPSPKSQETLSEAVAEICSRVLEEIDFVELASELINKLWTSEGYENASIRKPLISKLQELYRSRDNLLDSELQGYSSLLCELFNVLKIGDQPLKALTGPVFNVLKDLVDRTDTAQENILSFHVLIAKHGAFLEEQDKVKMQDLITEIRSAAIAETKKLRRCIFLEVIEMHASNWTLQNDIKIFYSDMLAELIEGGQDQK